MTIVFRRNPVTFKGQPHHKYTGHQIGHQYILQIHNKQHAQNHFLIVLLQEKKEIAEARTRKRIFKIDQYGK
jgi:hypothetical protein